MTLSYYLLHYVIYLLCPKYLALGMTQFILFEYLQIEFVISLWHKQISFSILLHSKIMMLVLRYVSSQDKIDKKG